MKKIINSIAVVILLISIIGCGKTPTWEEQYDLGVRYLSEGKYEEAIIAFTAAIEIDAKQAPAYVGRGDAYIGMGETDENRIAALSDYLIAIELDGQVNTYLKVAEIYRMLGDDETARTLLMQGYELTGDVALLEKFESLNNSVPIDMDYIEERLNSEYGLEISAYSRSDYDKDGQSETFFRGRGSEGLNSLFYCDNDGSNWTKLYEYTGKDIFSHGVRDIEINSVHYFCDGFNYREESETNLYIYCVQDGDPVCIFEGRIEKGIDELIESEDTLREIISQTLQQTQIE